MTSGARREGAKTKRRMPAEANNARAAAARALLRVETGAYSNLTLEGICAQAGLDPRETAFASALFYTALERRLTIDHILKHFSAKPLDQLAPAVLASLRLGVCQLLYLEGVDDYAGVSESVELVKALGEARASGYVNGILRAFLRADKKIPPVRGGRGDRLSVEYSCPRWLVKRLLKTYGDEALKILEASLGRPPLFLRANTTKISPDALAELLAAEGVEAAAEPDAAGCLRVTGRAVVEGLDAFEKGLFHVQDKASQLCALALNALPGEMVLDVCSAPGGKSFTIAETMENRGRVVAMDLHEKRACLVAEGARRLGLSIVEARAGDATRFQPELGMFDRVLCDVPCSGFGIIRRKPEIKYKTPDSVENLPEIQYKIVSISAQYVKRGGRLVYSTCTLLPEENGDVVRQLLETAEDLRLVSEETRLSGDTDGFYTAVLEKF